MDQKHYRLTENASEAKVFDSVIDATRATAEATSWPMIERFVTLESEDVADHLDLREVWHPTFGGMDVHLLWVHYSFVVRVEFEADGAPRTRVFYVAEVN
jgi:hypothetical protein